MIDPRLKFYMVKVVGGGAANTVYPTETMARLRAEALARETRQNVAVLEVLDICVPDVPVQIKTEWASALPEKP